MRVISEITECPDCKVDARLMNSLVREEIEKGNMDKGTIGYVGISVYGNINLSKPMIAGGRVPGARVYKDICTKCGKEFTVRIEVGHIIMPTRQDMPPVFS